MYYVGLDVHKMLQTLLLRLLALECSLKGELVGGVCDGSNILQNVQPQKCHVITRGDGSP